MKRFCSMIAYALVALFILFLVVQDSVGAFFATLWLCAIGGTVFLGIIAFNTSKH